MRFEEKAEAYERHAGVQAEVSHWLAEWVEREVCGLGAWEFGAGPGVFTRHLAERGFGQVTATDISPRMVREGQRRVPSARWEVMDAWEPSDLKVDRVYACSLLQWASEPECALRKWGELLSKGGRILFSVFVEGSMAELLVSAPELSALKWRTADEWRQMSKVAGFKVVRSECFVRRDSFRSAREALRSVHDIGAIRENRFGPGALRRILARVDARYQGDGVVPLTWKAVKLELALA